MKLVIFDIDGVILRDGKPLPEASETIKWLTDNNYKYAFVSNNSTKDPEVYVEKLSVAGIKSDVNQIITSSIATAMYLKEMNPKGGRVLVVGESGLHNALSDAEFEVVDFDDPVKVDYVIVGLDREFNYKKLARAQHEIYINNAEFIATNYDPIFPGGHGLVRPGGGIMVRAVEACTNQKAVIIGKPEPMMINLMLDKFDVKPHEAMIVGDNLDTDIPAGKNAGIRTAFVLTGVHTQEDLLRVDKDHFPDFVMKDLSSLKDCLE